jgi:hypothetical protein
MQVAYCPNCGKDTGHSRALGAGIILRTLLTGGLSLLAMPVYGKHCIICGLRAEQANPQDSSGTVAAHDQAQGWLVLLGVVVMVALTWRY